jgi:hypothetical protein
MVSRPKGKIKCEGQSKSSRIFFGINCLVHDEFVPPGQCVTGHLYVKVLPKLHHASCSELQSLSGN